MNEKKLKYVVVGTGARAMFFYRALATEYRDTCELVAFCDLNQTRMNFANRTLESEFNHPKVKTYHAENFENMIREEKPDWVIVTTVDRTHHTYIVKAMELGCDVITEKPMTIDIDKCQAILDVISRTGRKLKVAFNYRYAPHNTKIKELLMNDTIGEITSVHFEWLLNTHHGADYYRRWHRDKRNGGGLLVHKSTHHFDLVNFWLNTSPSLVFALGDLRFYGRENAESRGETRFYQRSHGSDFAKEDHFSLDLSSDETLRDMYLNAESEDGYQRDQSVFGDGISIEDTMAVMVKYDNKAVLTYSLNTYLPWEGFNVVFNGTKGRLEVKIVEIPYLDSQNSINVDAINQKSSIIVHPMFAAPYQVDYEELEGGHGGGDPLLLKDLFGVPDTDPYHRAASHHDGVKSILTGIAANSSIQTGLPVQIAGLVKF